VVSTRGTYDTPERASPAHFKSRLTALTTGRIAFAPRARRRAPAREHRNVGADVFLNQLRDRGLQRRFGAGARSRGCPSMSRAASLRGRGAGHDAADATRPAHCARQPDRQIAGSEAS
jgi:hypothetical protein